MRQPIVVITAFQEEAMLGNALVSLRKHGFDRIHVTDGSWHNFPGETFASTDQTEKIARTYGAVWHPTEAKWAGQEAKRTAQFHNCGATEEDHIFIFDADERVTAGITAELTADAYTVMFRTLGPNDLPGVRGAWPAGDYSTEYIPALRVFRYHPTLTCLWPGGYTKNGKLIAVYKRDPKAYGGYGSVLPVVEGLRFNHVPTLRPEQRQAQKQAYYAKEHPERRARQARHQRG